MHGNKGRKPIRTISDDIKLSVIDLYRKNNDANFTHYTELLEKHEDISISASSVSKILESEYILSPKVTRTKQKRIKKHLKELKKAAKTQKEADAIQTNLVAVEDAHSRRPRAAYLGELLQMDATPYEWIPVYGIFISPLFIASGRIVGGWFDTQETLNAYYHVFYQILIDYGIPYKFFTDRRTVFTFKKKNSPISR